MRTLRILNVVGARPNFIKIMPISLSLSRRPERFVSSIVHTGQHYDEAMSQVFFDQLGIPRPDVDLDVGSDTHARQTAAIMVAFEPVLLDRSPDLVLVVGDVNSTIACALVAVKRGVPVAHVEAGLRSFDRGMPEEINRVLTDQIADLLFTTERSAGDNLAREGVDASKVHFVGNVMIDTLLAHRTKARTLDVPGGLGLKDSFAVLTLHRPSNVDEPKTFERLMTAMDRISEDVPIVFPVHPRTRTAVDKSPIGARLAKSGRLRLLDPMGYLEFLGLMDASRVVLTDSGGIQEETTALGISCLTLRETTERPITVTEGTNRVVGTNPERVLAGWDEVRRDGTAGRIPELWDGHAAERIVEVLDRLLS